MAPMLALPAVAQVVPPGHLDQHATLLALTPSILAIGAALSVSVLANLRGARVVAWCGALVALAVQALFLIPLGAAGSYHEPLFHDFVRIGWAPDLTALLAGLWSFWQWRPKAEQGSLALWPGRIGLAFLLATVLMPGLVLACEPDDAEASARWRALRIAVVIAATLAMPWLGPAIAAAIALAFSAATGRGPWRPVLALCAVAAVLPPYPL